MLDGYYRKSADCLTLFFFLRKRRPPISTRPATLFPYTTLFRSWRFLPQATKATRLQASGTGVRTDAHAALRGPRAYAPIEQCSPAWSRSAIEHRRERSMTIERPWLAHYPAGIPAQIDRSEERSVGKEVVRQCRSRGLRYHY